jgi:hypothetical protein
MSDIKRCKCISVENQFMLNILGKFNVYLFQEAVVMLLFYGCANCNYKETRSSLRTFLEFWNFHSGHGGKAVQLQHCIVNFRNENRIVI